MPYNPGIHHRCSIRLKGYDYSRPGAYFITLCVKGHTHLFGAIHNGIMELNDYGEIVKYTWRDLPNHNADIILDQNIIMPDHFHGIIIITEPAFAGADSIFSIQAESERAGSVRAGSVRAGSVRAGSEPAPTKSAPTEPAPTESAPTEPAPTEPAPAKSPAHQGLPEIVRQLKTFSSRRINESRRTPGVHIWQRDYGVYPELDEGNISSATNPN